MTSAPFHPDLNRSEFVQLLEARFSFLQRADPRTVLDIEAAIGKFPTRGQPIDKKAVMLFQHADTEYDHGMTQETAIELAMKQFPDVKPRRKRTRKVDGHTDPDHDKLMLIAEYKRYLSRKKHGLGPTHYSRNVFFEFVLTKQWDRAAAVFRKANKQRRHDLCERLNRITLKNAE